MQRRELLALFAGGLSALPFQPLGAHENIRLPFASNNSLPAGFGDGRDWFFNHRFGLFVHWGLYALPAWHEQYQWRAGVPRAKYAQLAGEFNPKKFDPEQWLDLLQEAGMRYLTFTTKHHDGFCLWDTRQTDFNIMTTPYKKDILGLLADACHKRNIPLCLYYSIVDWHHPNYPNRGRHHELLKPEEGDQPDWNRYLDFLKAQIKELCTGYGTIHGIWWDMNVPEYYDPSINAAIRKWQPGAIINNRGFDEGDFGTPERDFDKRAGETRFFAAPTEACQSVDSLSWGYKKDAEYYSDQYLTQSIDRYLAAGANYLLNVGPTAEGLIAEPAAGLLRRLGRWYNRVRESYDQVLPTTQLFKGDHLSLTRREQTLYVHCHKTVAAGGLSLKGINVAPRKAVLLNNGQPVDFVVTYSPEDYADPRPFLRLKNLPVNELANETMVIKLEFEQKMVW